jgi:DNA-binding NtrC family response regulator
MRTQPTRRKQPIDLYINCVVMSSFRSEFTYLHNVFRPSGIRMHHAQSIDEADFLLTVTESTVLLADIVFADGSWQSALRLLRDQYPLVTMLVIADPIDQPFLRDLYGRGACGILWKPFDFQAARTMIRAVHEASKERRALREEIVFGNGQPREQSSVATVTDSSLSRVPL